MRAWQESDANDPVVEQLIVGLASGKANIQKTIELCRLLVATGHGGAGIEKIAHVGGACINRANEGLSKLTKNMYGCNLCPIWVDLTLKE